MTASSAHEPTPAFAKFLVIASFLLHAVTVVAYARTPFKLAAFTEWPIWTWGVIGLLLASLAYILGRAKLSLFIGVVWITTVFLGSEEISALLRPDRQHIHAGKPENFQNAPVIRVATFHASLRDPRKPGDAIAEWQPDIVFLQDVGPTRVLDTALALFGGGGDYRLSGRNAIISRWPIERVIRDSRSRGFQATIHAPGLGRFNVINIHLSGRRDENAPWRSLSHVPYSEQRNTHMQELWITREVLRATSDTNELPAIMAGDFNMPSSDPVPTMILGDQYIDSFKMAGSGWGYTTGPWFAPRRDCRIYATKHFQPVRSRTVATPFSDHRLVLTDYVTRF